MSHQPERKEKDCLNCGTIVAGKYCQVCGQENIVIKQGFFSLTRHFIYDIFHFDGKFFDTLKYLFTRPGYVPRQYTLGKRQSYLDPIRMYLFTSAVFFIIFFALKDPQLAMSDTSSPMLTRNERFDLAANMVNNPELLTDSLAKRKLALLLDTSYSIELEVKRGSTDNENDLTVVRNGKTYRMLPKKFTRVDSMSNGSWISRLLSSKITNYRKKFGDDTQAMFADFSNTFMHRMPYILFISLPIFALILKLLYFRRKDFLYADHVVFTLYHYILTFILLLVFFVLEAIQIKLNWGILDIIGGLLMFSIVVFLFVAMKRFYQQGKGKTFVKFIILNFLGLVSLMVLIALFVFLSIIQL